MAAFISKLWSKRCQSVLTLILTAFCCLSTQSGIKTNTSKEGYLKRRMNEENNTVSAFLKNMLQFSLQSSVGIPANKKSLLTCFYQCSSEPFFSWDINWHSVGKEDF